MYEAAASREDIARTPVTNWETPMCNACRIRLRLEARDENSAHNSVSCETLATLRR